MTFLINGTIDEFYEVGIYYHNGDVWDRTNVFDDVKDNYYLGEYVDFYDAYVIDEDDFNNLVEDLEYECDLYNSGRYSEIFGSRDYGMKNDTFNLEIS